MNGVAQIESFPDQFVILRGELLEALEVGEVEEARQLMDKILAADPSCAGTEEWAQFSEVTAWPDAWLIAAVRRDPSDEQALDALVDRYWKRLFGRCQMLTLNHERARDLAQEAWCRVLRARRSLKPDGNFAAYLMTVATNLWRDSNRSARRAGPLAEYRMVSLDAELPGDEGGTVALADVLPDLNALQAEEQTRLKLDIDRALAQLTPLLRDVLVARFLTGESCAEIGRRYGRTEQTVSAWVREGMREMRLHLEEPDSGT
jgi:RNA polymerase sigma-70 factor (ECF subfamily)